MSSKRASEPLDLERGLPTTAEDVAMLRRLGHATVRDEDLESFLASFPPPSHAELRRKPGPSGAPFRL